MENNKTLSYGSVCSGIEAASVAWHPLGWRAAWFAEIEPFPSSVLAHRFPTVPNLGDMTMIAGLIRAGLVDAPDVLVGGTPCQAFSVAGARAGLHDARGQLTLSYVDLLDAIDEQRPNDECVALWENVPGVLSDRTNAFGCFLGFLAGEVCALEPAGGKWSDAGCVHGPKRSIAWRILDAQHFGLAQRRRRVFVVASARKGFDPAAILFESDGVRRDTAPRRETGQDAAVYTTGSFAQYREGFGTLRANGGDNGNGSESIIVANAEGATGLPFLTASNISKTVNNQTPLLFGSGVAQSIRGDDRRSVPRATPDRRADASHVPAIAFSSKDYGNDAIVECAPTMRAMNHSGSHQNGGGQLAVCITGNITHTLKAEGFDASEDGTGRGQPITVVHGTQDPCVSDSTAFALGRNNGGENALMSGMAVRRLTPVECERLQGFPDDWTLVPHRNKTAADGPRYKSLGNSMAVPCMAWLGRRIAKGYR